MEKPENNEYSEHDIKYDLKRAPSYILGSLKWFSLALVVGAVCGSAGAAFRYAIEAVTEFRLNNYGIIFFLPLGALAITLIYRLLKQDNIDGTNFVISSIRKDGKVPFRMAPAIMFGTVATHFLGGSAGREGAALQLGGSLGSTLGKLFRLDSKDRQVMVLAGMGAVFSALFGTPLTAVVFVLEVISVGIIHYSALVPCIVASVASYYLTSLIGLEPEKFILQEIPSLDWPPLLLSLVMGVACAVLSIGFCLLIEKTREGAKRLIKNDYLRAAVGGTLILLLTIAVGTTDYNGVGSHVINKAISDGQANPEAFALKLLFTAITLAVGFRGGEIVPTFFVGATFGCVFGGLIGLNPSFAAALGLVGLFCGVTNSPIASLILSVELFGAEGLPYFAIVCALSYTLSGYFSLYKSQIIVYDKLKSAFVNKKTH